MVLIRVRDSDIILIMFLGSYPGQDARWDDYILLVPCRIVDRVIVYARRMRDVST
jgi:hypothetical protein